MLKHIIITLLITLPFLGVEMSPLAGSWVTSIVIWVIWAIVVVVYWRWIIKRKGRVKMEKDEEKMIIKDTEIKADVKHAKKATGMEVNRPAEISSTRVELNAEDVEEATGFSTNQGLFASMTICNCGTKIPYVSTGQPSEFVKCPKCGREHKLR